MSTSEMGILIDLTLTDSQSVGSNVVRVSYDSSASKVTCYGLDNQFPLESLGRGMSPEVKWPDHETHISPPSTAEVLYLHAQYML
jgi:hypothetical protein